MDEPCIDNMESMKPEIEENKIAQKKTAEERIIEAKIIVPGITETRIVDAGSPKPRINPGIMGTPARFIFAAMLFIAAGVLLQARSRYEVHPPRQPLAAFPATLGPWSGTDIPIPQDVLAILGRGEFLNRNYRAADSDRNPNAELFIAYYASQRTGETPHSPQHCLPGAGFTPIANDTIFLSYPGHAPFPANRYIVRKGDSRKLVLYWFWAHDRGIASEYWAKYYLIRDSIKMNRSDGAMVRVILDMDPGESPATAEERAQPFVAQILPLLDQYIPR
jgi:EpsI family protein